jgi:hypothetical protein
MFFHALCSVAITAVYIHESHEGYVCFSHVIVCNSVICHLIPQRTPTREHLTLVTELVVTCINWKFNDIRNHQIILMLEGTFIAIIFSVLFCHAKIAVIADALLNPPPHTHTHTHETSYQQNLLYIAKHGKLET